MTNRVLAVCLLLIFLALLTLVVLVTTAEADDPPAATTGTETVGDDDSAGGLSAALIQENAALRRRASALQRELTRSHRWFRRAMRTDPLGVTFLERAFLCIHHGEGAWTSNTGNGYFGGLQMDRQFMATYGPEFVRAFGTADRWPRAVQVAVAIRAYLSGRGFRPWPNTARSCGVL